MLDFTGRHFTKLLILQALRWYLSYPLSYRHVEELMKERGVNVDHSTINRWVIKYAKELEALFSKQFRKYGSYISWKMDETYLKHKGKDVYLYRAIDKHGDTLEFMVSAKRDENVMKLLTKLSILNLFHPFQTFMLGQKVFPIKTALKYEIPLIFYGENEAERGNEIKDNLSSLRNNAYHTYENKNSIYLGGVSYTNLLKKFKLEEKDLEIFLPPIENC